MPTREQVNTATQQTLSQKTLSDPLVTGGLLIGAQLQDCTSTDPIVPEGVATKQYVDAQGSPPVVGVIKMYGGLAAPASYLLCDGAAVSRTTFVALFGVLGEVFGPGDGSTTFNVPDMRGRSPLGAGQGTSLTNRPLGGAGGEENHVLTVPELPSHDHVLPSGGQVVTTVTGPFGMYSPGTWGLNQTLNPAGGNVAHNTLHPFLTVTFIIKT